jgi:hypothetical protein
MFKQITIVQLTDADPLLDYEFSWPSKVSKRISAQRNLELLQHAKIISDISDVADIVMSHDKQSGYETVIFPVHYHVRPDQTVVEILGDLSQEHHQALRETLLSVIPDIESSSAQKFWYCKQALVDEMQSEDILLSGRQPNAGLGQEIEMLFYQHKVNLDRVGRQKRLVSGVWMVKVLGSCQPTRLRVVTDAAMMAFFGEVCQLDQWLENPSSGCVVVLGAELGDGRLQALKSVIECMLESGGCDMLKVVSPGKEIVYSASLFYSLTMQVRDYLFSKQTI